MKYLLIPILLLCGCATLDPNLTSQQKAQAIADQDGPLITAAVDIATRAALQYCEQNPAERDSVKDEMHRISEAVSVLANGNLDPESLTKALKVKEVYIQDILNAIVPIYKAGYERLNEVGEARLALQYLRLIADGIKSGTE